jgi:ELWxxDGT repeat protein
MPSCTVRASFALALAVALPVAAAADVATQLFDLWPGPDPGAPSFDAAVFDGRLCFRGRNDPTAPDATGDELYCYDGTTVTLAADVLPGGTGSFPRELTVYDGQLYFSAENPFDDNELWRWDGTNPPVEVFDLRAGGESAPRELTVYDGQLYFSADDDGAAGGRALWRYDSSQPLVVGTNPMLVQDFSTTDLGTPRDWLVFEDILYFPAPPQPNHGEELFRFDGSQPIVDGTNPRIVVDLDPGQPGSDPADLTAHDDGNFYFSAVTSLDVGRRLYRSNGNNLPTLLSSTLDLQGDLVSYGGELLFFAQDQDPAALTGTELWSYDGTSFTRVEPGAEYIGGGPFAEIDGLLYFVAPQGSPLDGHDLYKYDGTGPPAPAVALFSTIGDANYPVGGFSVFGGLLYFNARSTAGGIELWALEAEGGQSPPSGTIQFASAAFAVAEGAGVATLTFTRTGGSSGPIAACYETITGGTATLDADYEDVQGVISFGDGETAPQIVGTFDILDDPDLEGDETVHVRLFTGLNCPGPSGTPDTAVVTIDDDDAAPASGVIQFSAVAYAVGEGDGTATITLVRTGGSDGTIGACFRAVAGTATSADFTPVDTLVGWAPGDTTPRTRTVPILDDPDGEGPETVELSLYLDGFLCSGPLGIPSQAILTILDNDGLAAPLAIPSVSEWGLLLLATGLALLALSRLRG